MKIFAMKQGETYWKQRSVIFREDDDGGRARVTTGEERVAYCEDVEWRWGYEGKSVLDLLDTG